MSDPFFQYLVSPDHLVSAQQRELRNLLGLNGDPSSLKFQTSHVFNRITKENLVNPHLRASQKIEYRDAELFDWVQKNVVNPLNMELTESSGGGGDSGDGAPHMILVRNDLEVVKYNPGDFFDKHQDYINFDSNEFRNYTFLICLQAAEEGGETLFYLNEVNGANTANLDAEPLSVRETAKTPGSLVVFQKNLVHAGAKVVAGTKMILKGNLIAMERPNNIQEDAVIVYLDQVPGQPVYSIPVSRLKAFPTCVYKAFYDFEKRTHGHQHVFHYLDRKLSETEFWPFYCRIMGIDPLEPGKYKQIQDYLGLTPSTPEDQRLAEFHRFLNGHYSTGNDATMETFPTRINEYYHYLSVIDWEKYPDILPYQMVTLESEGHNFIAWLGAYDNLLLTIDQFQKKVCGLCTDYPESEETGDLHDLSLPLIDDREDIIPNYCWRHLADGDCSDETLQEIRQEIFKQFSFKPMDLVTTMADKRASGSGSGHPLDQMRNYVFELINRIGQHGEGADGIYTPDQPGVSSDFTPINTSSGGGGSGYHVKRPSLNLIRDNWADLEVNSISKQIQKETMLSCLGAASMSEFFCNETYYITYNCIFRFGFLRPS